MFDDNDDDLLTEIETARVLGYSPRTLAAWRYRGGGPPFVRVSATSIRYRRGDVRAWIGARTQEITGTDEHRK